MSFFDKVSSFASSSWDSVCDAAKDGYTSGLKAQRVVDVKACKIAVSSLRSIERAAGDAATALEQRVVRLEGEVVCVPEPVVFG